MTNHGGGDDDNKNNKNDNATQLPKPSRTTTTIRRFDTHECERIRHELFTYGYSMTERPYGDDGQCFHSHPHTHSRRRSTTKVHPTSSTTEIQENEQDECATTPSPSQLAHAARAKEEGAGRATSDDASESNQQQQQHSLPLPLPSLPMLSLELVEFVHDRYERMFYRGDFETGQYPDEWHWRHGISLPNVTREICNGWKSDRLVASIILNETMGQNVAQIMNWTSVRIGQDDLIWKPPISTTTTTTTKEEEEDSAANAQTAATATASTVGYHQDSAYISTQFVPYENNSVTVWIALDDVNDKDDNDNSCHDPSDDTATTTGCLEYVVGSHVWPVQHNHPREEDGEGEEELGSNTTSTTTTNAFHGTDDYRSSIPSTNPNRTVTRIRKATPCHAGYAVFHHQDVWHGSGPNRSCTKHRRALVGHYIRGDVQWKSSSTSSTASPTTPTKPPSSQQNQMSPPWGTNTYIYGRYRSYTQDGTKLEDELNESFFPIIYATPESGYKRTPWLDSYCRC